MNLDIVVTLWQINYKKLEKKQTKNELKKLKIKKNCHIVAKLQQKLDNIKTLKKGKKLKIRKKGIKKSFKNQKKKKEKDIKRRLKKKKKI